MPSPAPNDLRREFELLFAAADEFNQVESPGPTGEKRPSPDGDQSADNSSAEGEDDDPGNESQLGLE